MRVTILGSGTSTGVPVIGCFCPVCTSTSRLDKRTRASIAIQPDFSTQTVLVDSSPEMRLQLLAAGIYNVAAVLYTHIHADHCHGFDDLKAFYFYSKKALPCYMPRQFIKDFKQRFPYAFEDTGYIGLPPQIDLKTLDFGPFRVNDTWDFEAFELPHGSVKSFGYRIGSFAYFTDFKTVSAEIRSRLRGKLTVMVASGLRFAEHPTHSNISETTELFKDLRVPRGILSHLSHDVSHAAVSERLPNGVELAYDGMIIDV